MGRTVEIRVLPDGKYRIHWWVFDPNGPAEVPSGLVQTSGGKKRAGGAAIADDEGHVETRGRIACEPTTKDVLPMNRRGMIRLCLKTDDPRAVSCSECRATQEWKAAMDNLSTLRSGV